MNWCFSFTSHGFLGFPKYFSGPESSRVDADCDCHSIVLRRIPQVYCCAINIVHDQSSVSFEGAHLHPMTFI